jgi:hypothetical protein
MPKFRKKPVIIEAEQFHPHQHPWPGGVKLWPDEAGLQPRDMTWGYIDTLEGRMHVTAGDWIITGVKGEPYPCKPDIFEQTYEPLTDEEKRMARAIDEANRRMQRWDSLHGQTVAANGDEK